jgi:hypothetical protein
MASFSTFIELQIGDRNISFVASFDYGQTRDAGFPVYTITGSTQSPGGALQQYAWTTSFTIIQDATEEDVFAIQNISVSDNIQMSVTFNRPGAPNDELDFSGVTWIFSGGIPQNESGNISDGNPLRRPINMYFRKRNVVGAET